MLSAANLKELSIDGLSHTSEENRAVLMEMAQQMFSVATTLQQLYLSSTYTSEEVGVSVVQALADSDITSLQEINFSWNSRWFNSSDSVVDTLIEVVIPR